jgi:hypothetical protein
MMSGREQRQRRKALEMADRFDAMGQDIDGWRKHIHAYAPGYASVPVEPVLVVRCKACGTVGPSVRQEDDGTAWVHPLGQKLATVSGAPLRCCGREVLISRSDLERALADGVPSIRK